MSDKTQTNILYIERNRKKGFSIHKVFQPLMFINAQNSASIEVPSPLADLFSLTKNILWTFRHRNKKGINHITGDVHYLTMALPGCKTVLTVHDLVALKISGNPLKKWLLRTLWFTIPLRQANHITCISNTTREALLHHFHISPSKVTTVYNPVDTMFRRLPKQFNVSEPRILHIGTGWNKNLLRVIDALKNIKCKLVIVGELNSEQQTALKLSGLNYEQRANITDEQLLHEYDICDIVSFPSIYEGFGMPIIEGQTVGRVILTSDLAPMTEISNGSSVLVDPECIESIRNGFMRIIKDADYRNMMIDKGYANAARFTVEKIAKQYDAIYHKVI